MNRREAGTEKSIQPVSFPTPPSPPLFCHSLPFSPIPSPSPINEPKTCVTHTRQRLRRQPLYGSWVPPPPHPPLPPGSGRGGWGRVGEAYPGVLAGNTDSTAPSMGGYHCRAGGRDNLMGPVPTRADLR